MLVLLQVNVIDKGLVPTEHLDLTCFTVSAPLTRLWQYGAGTVHIRPQCRSSSGIGKLRLALFEGTNGRLIPGGQIVKNANTLQGELEFDWQANVDWKHNRLFVGFFRPSQFLFPAVGVRWIVDNRVPVDWTPAGLGQLYQEVVTEFLQRAAHGPFDCAAIEFPHHFGHLQEFFARCYMGG